MPNIESETLLEAKGKIGILAKVRKNMSFKKNFTFLFEALAEALNTIRAKKIISGRTTKYEKSAVFICKGICSTEKEMLFLKVFGKNMARAISVSIIVDARRSLVSSENFPTQE